MPKFYPWIFKENKAEVKSKTAHALMHFESEEIKKLFSLSSNLSNEDKLLCLSLLFAYYCWSKLSNYEKERCYVEARNFLSKNIMLTDEQKNLLSAIVLNTEGISIHSYDGIKVKFCAFVNDIANFPFPLNIKCLVDILNADIENPQDIWGIFIIKFLRHDPLNSMTFLFNLKVSLLLKASLKQSLLVDEFYNYFDIAPELMVALSHSIYEPNLSDIFYLLFLYSKNDTLVDANITQASRGIVDNFIGLMPKGDKKKFYISKQQESQQRINFHMKSATNARQSGFFNFKALLPGIEKSAQVLPYDDNDLSVKSTCR